MGIEIYRGQVKRSMIRIVKLGPGSKEKTTVNTALLIGQSNCGTKWLKRHY
jgi:hypothetical protein